MIDQLRQDEAAATESQWKPNVGPQAIWVRLIPKATPPKYCTIALGRKKRHLTRHQGNVLGPLSQRSCQTPGSSATQ
jgi:hypothetical protein